MSNLLQNKMVGIHRGDFLGMHPSHTTFYSDSLLGKLPEVSHVILPETGTMSTDTMMPSTEATMFPMETTTVSFLSLTTRRGMPVDLVTGYLQQAEWVFFKGFLEKPEPLTYILGTFVFLFSLLAVYYAYGSWTAHRTASKQTTGRRKKNGDITRIDHNLNLTSRYYSKFVNFGATIGKVPKMKRELPLFMLSALTSAVGYACVLFGLTPSAVMKGSERTVFPIVFLVWFKNILFVVLLILSLQTHKSDSLLVANLGFVLQSGFLWFIAVACGFGIVCVDKSKPGSIYLEGCLLVVGALVGAVAHLGLASRTKGRGWKLISNAAKQAIIREVDLLCMFVIIGGLFFFTVNVLMTSTALFGSGSDKKQYIGTTAEYTTYIALDFMRQVWSAHLITKSPWHIQHWRGDSPENSPRNRQSDRAVQQSTDGNESDQSVQKPSDGIENPEMDALPGGGSFIFHEGGMGEGGSTRESAAMRESNDHRRCMGNERMVSSEGTMDRLHALGVALFRYNPHNTTWESECSSSAGSPVLEVGDSDYWSRAIEDDSFDEDDATDDSEGERRRLLARFQARSWLSGFSSRNDIRQSGDSGFSPPHAPDYQVDAIHHSHVDESHSSNGEAALDEAHEGNFSFLNFPNASSIPVMRSLSGSPERIVHDTSDVIIAHLAESEEETPDVDNKTDSIKFDSHVDPKVGEEIAASISTDSPSRMQGTQRTFSYSVFNGSSIVQDPRSDVLVPKLSFSQNGENADSSQYVPSTYRINTPSDSSGSNGACSAGDHLSGNLALPGNVEVFNMTAQSSVVTQHRPMTSQSLAGFRIGQDTGVSEDTLFGASLPEDPLQATIKDPPSSSASFAGTVNASFNASCNISSNVSFDSPRDQHGEDADESDYQTDEDERETKPFMKHKDDVTGHKAEQKSACTVQKRDGGNINTDSSSNGGNEVEPDRKRQCTRQSKHESKAGQNEPLKFEPLRLDGLDKLKRSTELGRHNHESENLAEKVMISQNMNEIDISFESFGSAGKVDETEVMDLLEEMSIASVTPRAPVSAVGTARAGTSAETEAPKSVVEIIESTLQTASDSAKLDAENAQMSAVETEKREATSGFATEYCTPKETCSKGLEIPFYIKSYLKDEPSHKTSHASAAPEQTADVSAAPEEAADISAAPGETPYVRFEEAKDQEFSKGDRGRATGSKGKDHTKGRGKRKDQTKRGKGKDETKGKENGNLKRKSKGKENGKEVRAPFWSGHY